MANHKSAKKATRKAIYRTEVNKSRMNRIRTYTRKAEEALAAKDATTSPASVLQAEREIMRGVNKGVIHKNTAARKISGLVQRLKKILSA